MSTLSNARSVIKIDIVKPIPPKQPAPTIFFHLRPVGNVQRPNPAPINEKIKMPKGFPIIRPARMP